MTQIIANDSLTSLVSGMGTDRDKSATVSYAASYLTDEEIVNAYRGAWLPRKIVDQPAQDAFRKWRSWQGDTSLNGRIEAEEKRLGLRGKFERAYTLARLFRRAHVYFDLGDDPAEPVNLNRIRRGGIRFATVLSCRELSDGDIDDDPMSPTYGEPRWYDLMSPSQGLVRIHPSRLVTFWGDDDPQDMVYGRRGRSVLEAAFPAIKRHDATVSNVAGLVFEARVDVITVPGLGELLADQEQGQAILNRFRLMATMKGNNGMVLLSGTTNKDLPSETWEQKNATFATLPDIIEKAQEEVSAAAKIPRAILFGASSGGLGSTGDLELSAYYDMIGSVQKNDIEPAISTLDECLIRSALGNRPADLWYEWDSLWQTSDKERAEIADRITTSAERLIRMGMPADVAIPATVSALVECGMFPGLEKGMDDYLAENDDTLEPEMDEADLPGGSYSDEPGQFVNDAIMKYKPPMSIEDMLGAYLSVD